MMPWNRKELWMGDSAEHFSRIREMLQSSGIPCDHNVRSASWSGGRGLNARTSDGIAARYAEGVKADKLYYLYVHKYEYEKAAHLLNKMPGTVR